MKQGNKYKKWRIEEKESIIKSILFGSTGVRTVAREKNISTNLIYGWIEKYNNRGISGLNRQISFFDNAFLNKSFMTIFTIIIIIELNLN